MQNFVIKTLSILPNTIAFLPYDVAHKVIVILAKSYGINCWVRNSYHFKKIVPGISDIDFTLMYDSHLDIPRLMRFFSFYQKIKFFIPILGEINFYNKETLYLTEKWINPFELKRDPNLKKYLHGGDENLYYRSTYLLRMLEADSKYLKNNIKARLKKWNFHLSELNLEPINELQIHKLIEIISQEIPISYPKEDISKILLKYVTDGIAEAYSYLRNNRAIKIFIILFPHRWLVYANGINDVEICLKANKFTNAELNLIKNQFHWELVGLQSQIISQMDKSKAMTYLELIAKFFQLVQASDSEPNLSEIKKDVELLIVGFQNHL